MARYLDTLGPMRGYGTAKVEISTEMAMSTAMPLQARYQSRGANWRRDDEGICACTHTSSQAQGREDISVYISTSKKGCSECNMKRG